jgi:hypothetical protein
MPVTFRLIHSDLGFERDRQIAAWDRPFYNPIELPNGKPLVTLRDAALYITQLTKAEHGANEWQAATEALILVDDRDGPAFFAHIGMMRALNRHAERVLNPSRKDHPLGPPEARAGSMTQADWRSGRDVLDV